MCEHFDGVPSLSRHAEREASQRLPLNVKSERGLQGIPFRRSLYKRSLQDVIEPRRQYARLQRTFAAQRGHGDPSADALCQDDEERLYRDVLLRPCRQHAIAWIRSRVT